MKKSIKKAQKSTKDTALATYNYDKSTMNKRFLIGTPTMGTVRMEFVSGRYGQIIPTNFSLADVQQFMSPYMPYQYQVADAENLIAKMFMEQNFEHLLMWEDDNIPPNDSLIRFNEYMIRGDTPIVSGVYFTKSVPPEPMVYKEPGRGYFGDWKLGEKVWVKGIPFGFALIHRSIIEALWDESPEYVVNGITTRRVFNTPSFAHVDPETGGWMAETGTSDLAWCKRIIEHDIFTKAGWPEYAKKTHPFLVDTSIFVKHIDRNTGTIYPTGVPKAFLEGKMTWTESIKKMRS